MIILVMILRHKSILKLEDEEWAKRHLWDVHCVRWEDIQIGRSSSKNQRQDIQLIQLNVLQ
jgi:hypothetical protein